MSHCDTELKVRTRPSITPPQAAGGPPEGRGPGSERHVGSGTPQAGFPLHPDEDAPPQEKGGPPVEAEVGGPRQFAEDQVRAAGQGVEVAHGEGERDAGRTVDPAAGGGKGLGTCRAVPGALRLAAASAARSCAIESRAPGWRRRSPERTRRRRAAPARGLPASECLSRLLPASLDSSQGTSLAQPANRFSSADQCSGNARQVLSRIVKLG